jgi:hypothetical protein
MTLTQELYARCRATLLKCGEFDSHASLQAVFVTAELTLYRDGLPTTSRKNERVSETIGYLLPKRLSDGRSVLPVFLTALCARYNSGDELHDELGKRCSEAEQELDRVRIIDVPFIIAAMTHDEATDLIAGTVFDNPTVAPVERTRFREFREALHEHGIADLLSHYGEHRIRALSFSGRQANQGQCLIRVSGVIPQSCGYVSRSRRT